MARFKNKKTGNIVNVKDKGTIALMEKSEQYEAVKEKKKGNNAGAANGLGNNADDNAK